jgi:hypothetical protein
VWDEEPWSLVRRARQCIGYFSSGNLGLRSGHAQSLSRRVVNRQTPAQHPTKAAVFVLHAVFTLEVRRQSSLMRGDFILNPFTIRDSSQKTFSAVAAAQRSAIRRTGLLSRDFPGSGGFHGLARTDCGISERRFEAGEDQGDFGAFAGRER